MSKPLIFGGNGSPVGVIPAIEGSLYQQLDAPNGAIWFVHNGAWVLLSGGNLALFATVCVARNGNDSTGDGSLGNPYLTIAKADTVITGFGDASATKPYRILASPGVYPESFSLNPWRFLMGSGARATIIANPSANWLGAGFSAAGIQEVGIYNCKINSDMVVDFAARSSPGQGVFYLQDCGWGDNSVDITVTGNNINNSFFWGNTGADGVSLGVGPTPSLNVNNIDVALHAIGLRNSSLNGVNTAAYPMKIRQNGCRIGKVNLTCSDVVNFLSYQCEGPLHAYSSTPVLTMTGDGCLANGHLMKYVLTTPDANTAYAPGAVASTVRLVSQGWNYLTTPTQTAARTHTVSGDVIDHFTTIIHKNDSTFPVTWVFTVGSNPPTFVVPPGGYMHAYVANSAWHIATTPIAALAGGTAILDVANIAEMQATIVTGLLDGTPCWVRTLQRQFFLTTTAGGTDASRDIYTSAAAGRLWIGSEVSNYGLWRQQATWVIDPGAGGNDENSGIDNAHALKTCAERQRRVGRGYVVKQPTTITYLASPPTTDVELFNRPLIGLNSTLTIQGQRTVAATGTLTGFTPKNRNPPTPTKNQIADTGLAGGFGPHVGRLCRITSGPRVNTAWVITANLGGGVAEITTPGTTDPTGFGSFTRATPQVGDAYEIVTVPLVTCGDWAFGTASNQDPPTGFNRIIAQDLSLDFCSSGVINLAAGITTDFSRFIGVRLIMTNAYFRTPSPANLFQTWHTGSLIPAPGSIVSMRAGAMINGHVEPGVGARVQLDFDFMFDVNGPVASRGSFIEIGSCGVFNNNGDGIGINPGSTVALIQGFDPEGSFLWGTNNAGRGVASGGDGSIFWWTGTGGHKPTINQGLGLGRELRLNGRDFLWADAPVQSNGATAGEWNQ